MIGDTHAINRYERYDGAVYWKEHGIYFKTKIERAYRKLDGDPCALYRAIVDNETLTAVNLSGIKDEIKTYRWAIE